MLPQMIPLRLRNQSEYDTGKAQNQYSPFRTTEFSTRDDDGEANCSPGSLFREEWNSMAVNLHKKTVSLYRSDRDVNPTPEAMVQTFYNAHELHDLAIQLKNKGNTVSALKSATPRFQALCETKGPGAYSPEKYHSAFPLLLEKVSPGAAMKEKQTEKALFDTAFAIGPATGPHSVKFSASLPSSSPRELIQQLGRPRPSAFNTLVSPRSRREDGSGAESLGFLQSARLAPELTPRNAYHNGNRQLLLEKSLHH